MKILKRLIRHVLFNREVYLFPLGAIGMLLASLFGVYKLTGRAVVDDPGAIVGFVYNAMGLVILAALVGVVQAHLFGFRGREVDYLSGLTPPPPPFRDDVFDACVSAFLFLFFGWLLWH